MKLKIKLFVRSVLSVYFNNMADEAMIFGEMQSKQGPHVILIEIAT